MSDTSCSWQTRAVTNRNEFRTQSETRACGAPTQEGGLYCAKHNDVAKQQYAAAEFKRQQREARANRVARIVERKGQA